MVNTRAELERVNHAETPKTEYLPKTSSNVPISTLLKLPSCNRVRIDINFVLIVGTVGGVCLHHPSSKTFSNLFVVLKGKVYTDTISLKYCHHYQLSNTLTKGRKKLETKKKDCLR